MSRGLVGKLGVEEDASADARGRPVKCLEIMLRLQGDALRLPRSYIYATRITPANTFGPFAACARNNAGWRYFEIDASHSPNVTAPEALMALLQKIVT